MPYSNSAVIGIWTRALRQKGFGMTEMCGVPPYFSSWLLWLSGSPFIRRRAGRKVTTSCISAWVIAPVGSHPLTILALWLAGKKHMIEVAYLSARGDKTDIWDRRSNCILRAFHRISFDTRPRMLFKSVLTSVLSRVPGASIAREEEQSPTNTPLNITALSSRGGYSVLECWQLETEAVSARSALNWIVSANTTQAELSIIQPRTTVGEAWAPAVQYVFAHPACAHGT